MKKWLIPVVIIAIVALGIYRWAVGFNNTAVEHEENAKTTWSNVESSYQRRNDLIGNLVKTAAFQQAQSGLTGALSKLMVVVERYPELKANQNFLELQSQLEGTENRINVARDRFNEGVNIFNKHIKTFPNKLLAGTFGFEEMARYKADAGSEKAPDVDFDFGSKKE